MNLSAKDFEILEYLDKNVWCDKVIGQEYWGEEFAYRLSQLLDAHLIEDLRHRTRPDDSAQLLGLYVLTNAGKCQLTDYHDRQQLDSKESKTQFIHEFLLLVIGGIIGLVTGYLLK